uniref:SWI/SNF complex subunit SWI3A n=1 Tax=Aegilops tauschii TaxID=37682 RepID=R7W8Z1_AEGTA
MTAQNCKNEGPYHETRPRAPRGRQPHAHAHQQISPSTPRWFRWDDIHETERQALPDFFGGAGGTGFGTASRNPRIYREYRDYIINKYREDPARRLTFTEVRKALVGDATLLRKLFGFLDASGLINFSATSSRPAAQQPGPGAVVEAPLGLQVTPRPPASYFVEERLGGGTGDGPLRLPQLTSYTDVFGEWTPGKGPICGFCGDECKDGKVETLKTIISIGPCAPRDFPPNISVFDETLPDIQYPDYAWKDGFKVCSTCCKTNSAKEEANKCSIVKKESSDNHASSAWTDAETLLLLEGVLKHGDDWDLITQHVRTKNKTECIARLIQLPFGEHMLGNINNGKSDSRFHTNQTTDGKTNHFIVKEASSQSADMVDGMQIDGEEDGADKLVEDHPSKRRRLCSSLDVTSSLMEQLALLTTAVSPDVVAAAAAASIKALGNENPQAKKAFHLSEKEYQVKSFSSNHVQESDCNVGNKEAEMHGQTVPDKKMERNFISTAYQVRAAVGTAVGVAAARAKMLVDQEEREMELLMASIIETQTGHELPEREKDAYARARACRLALIEKDAYARSRACRLALIDHGVAHKKPPLNAFKPHPEHKSKLICNITGDTINKSEEHIWKHVNGKRFLNKLEKLEEKMASGETGKVEGEQSNEVAKKSKSTKKKDKKKEKKEKKKAAVANPSLPREPEPEIDDSDDSEFWVPPVGSRWDDDDGKDRWESSPGKDDIAEDEGASDDEDDDEMADKDDEVSEELASRTKRLSVEAVGPSSFATRKKKPRKDE